MNPYVQATVTVLAVVNPVVCGAILVKIVARQPRADRIKAATKAALIVLVILVGTAFAGQFVLDVFGISMEAFRIVGGAIIAYIGFQMLGGGSHSDDDQSGGSSDLSTLVMFAHTPASTGANKSMCRASWD